MLLAIEPLLLQDEGRNAVFNERQPGIMGSTYESEDAHGCEDGLCCLGRMRSLSQSTRHGLVGSLKEIGLNSRE